MVNDLHFIPDHLVLYDGECGLCHRSVQWILRHDREEHFSFCSQQSERGQRVLSEFGKPLSDSSTVYYVQNGTEIYDRSTAALNILKLLPGCRALSQVLMFIPRWMRDPWYQLVSRYRTHFFPLDSCSVMDHSYRARFLDQD